MSINGVTKSPSVQQYLDEAARYALLTGEEEAVFGRMLRGEASLDILVSPGTFLFARDYAAQTVAFTPHSQFERKWKDYVRAYPCSGNGFVNGSLDEEVTALRQMYSNTLTHYDGFVATTARYLIGREEYAHHVSPPLWRTAWKKQDSGFVALRKKKDPRMVLSFSEETLQYAREHSDAEKVLYRAYQQLYGNAAAAQKQLVTSNLRLVISIAKQYINRDVELEDLIQLGNLGLIKSLEKFESTRGFKFSTYASWWIRQSIVRGLQETSRPIRVPVHALEKINQIRRLEKEYRQILGREPRASEFRAFAAERIGITPDNVDKLLLRKLRLKTNSLDDPISSDAEALVGEMYTVPEHAESILVHAQPQQVDLSYNEGQICDEIDAVISDYLSPREETVIRMRFGIGQPRSYALEEVGTHFNLTRERIRQIELRAIKKLRRHDVDLRDL